MTPLALQPPDPRLILRPVRLSDADDLHVACWPNRSFAAVYNLIKRAYYNGHDGRGLGLVVAGPDEAPRGYGQYVLWPTAAEISDLIVCEAQRGQGLGTALVQALVQAAARTPVDVVEIGAALTNPRAIALYRRLGFEDSHTLVLTLETSREPVLFLRLSLRGAHPRLTPGAG